MLCCVVLYAMLCVEIFVLLCDMVSLCVAYTQNIIQRAHSEGKEREREEREKERESEREREDR